MVVAYRLESLSYALARLLVRTEFVGLPNLLAGRELVPERLQGQATRGKISRCAAESTRQTGVAGGNCAGVFDAAPRTAPGRQRTGRRRGHGTLGRCFAPAMNAASRLAQDSASVQMRWDWDACSAGVDEAGRGPLAGPVVAGAVVLDPQHPIDGLKDSKRLSAKRRDELAALIRERAVAHALGRAEVAEIDQLNILQATLLAMRRGGLPVWPCSRSGCLWTAITARI